MALPRSCFANFVRMALLSLAALAATARAEGLALYKDATQSVDARVEDLLKRMSLEEKASLTAGQDYFSTCAIPRLGIPSLRMSDGPNGVRWGISTAFPTGICLAASWDPALAERYGQALGQEARGQGRDMLLGPCVNINRHPLGGRSFESLGEDPYLAARMAVSYVLGVQSQGVAACIKHFAANNEETDRMSVDARVDERVLREIYLPAFEAAVQEGRVQAVMAAYNRLNGPYCSANPWLEKQVLKDEWGFQGLVVSDWGATHEGSGALRAGLDLEMPGPGDFLGAKLLPDLAKDPSLLPALDDAVRHVLRVIFALGLFDRDPGKGSTALHRDLARECAEEGAVLLKDEGGLLPLAPGLRSLAVLGPNAAVARTGGGGSSKIDAVDPVSPLEGLRRRLGPGVTIRYAQGSAGDELTPLGKDFIKGLKAEYFANMNLEGEPVLQRDEEQLDYDWGGDKSPGPGIPHDGFSARWTCRLVPKQGGNYMLGLSGDDGYRLYMDGKLLLENWNDHARQTRTAPLSLSAGHSYDLKVEYYQDKGGASVTLGWQRMPQELLDEAVLAAKQSDVAVVFVGLSELYEGEGFDRASFGLPQGQSALIQAVLAANPHTVVVLNSGSPVDLEPWIGSVPAVMEAWYPGLEEGKALAALLSGDLNPGGKLPVSFPDKISDAPAFGNFPGKEGTVRYAEGLLVGYRYYDTRAVAPLFPFGHGLSYTQFGYAGLKLSGKGRSLRLEFTVQNTGGREGSEVAQVYVRPLHARVLRPFQELKGFQRLKLAPSASQGVGMDLDARAFSYWDPGRKAWREDRGPYEIRVGSSSRDIRLKKVWNLTP